MSRLEDRGFNLDSDKVFRVVEPSMRAVSPAHSVPITARTRRTGQQPRRGVPEVSPVRYGVDVHEDGVAAEVSAQTVVEPPGKAGRS